MFSHLPAMHLGGKIVKEKIPGEPQEASVGGHISLAAANELP